MPSRLATWQQKNPIHGVSLLLFFFKDKIKEARGNNSARHGTARRNYSSFQSFKNIDLIALHPLSLGVRFLVRGESVSTFMGNKPDLMQGH